MQASRHLRPSSRLARRKRECAQVLVVGEAIQSGESTHNPNTDGNDPSEARRYEWLHGLTAPLWNVRKRRFRKHVERVRKAFRIPKREMGGTVVESEVPCLFGPPPPPPPEPRRRSKTLTRRCSTCLTWTTQLRPCAGVRRERTTRRAGRSLPDSRLTASSDREAVDGLGLARTRPHRRRRGR